MIITSECYIKLNNKNIKYFESLGYQIPRYKNKNGRKQCKRGTKILVKVQDLQPCSTQKIKVRCFRCNKERWAKVVNCKDNTKTSCHKCKNIGWKNGRYYHGLGASYSMAKGQSKSRKILFQLTPDEFRELTVNVSCYYCGEVSKGIDRLNSKIGYIKYNCVPCCKTCNYLKRDATLELFLSKIQKIYLKHISK